MTVTLFITLLTTFSFITGFAVEAVKKVLTDKKVSYSSNALACIVAGVVGVGGTAAYYALTNIGFTTGNVVCMVLMGVAVALGAMVGYDKVIQTIKQFKTK